MGPCMASCRHSGRLIQEKIYDIGVSTKAVIKGDPGQGTTAAMDTSVIMGT